MVCPACHHLLHLPASEDQVSTGAVSGRKKPLGEVARFSSGVPSLGPERLSRSPQGKKRSSAESVSWEGHAPSNVSSGGGGAGSKIWGVVACLFTLAVLGVGAWLFMGGEGKDAALSSNDSKELNVSSIEGESAGSSEKDFKKKPTDAESETLDIGDLEDAYLVINTFLSTEKLSVLEGMVRTPEVTVPRMRAWYKTHALKASEVKEIGYRHQVRVKGALVIIGVLCSDSYLARTIVLEKVDGRFLVDWESWVGWGDLDWKELFKQRPTKPVELRVIASKDDYYNREFKDEHKWLSVRLERPGEDRLLYGYIDSQSPKLMRFRGDLRSGKPAHVTIKVRYPESAEADNQVIIEEYLQRGWVKSSQPLPNQTPPTSNE